MPFPLYYIERASGEKRVEKIYGEKALRFLYSPSKFSRFFLKIFVRSPLFSCLYGWWQKQGITAQNIRPFIREYHIDASEFLDPIDQFTSFNAFFCRKLKAEVRPIVPDENIAILPVDGRFLCIPHLARQEGLYVKGEVFSLEELLRDKALAKHYSQGSMVIGRLCPTDYHRFHFPCSGIPHQTRLINGAYYSVNPLALMHNIHTFTENKRMITQFDTKAFGTILYIEVGATSVGSIQQTFTPDQPYRKGEEKGFFSFGGSAVLLLFEPGRILFDADLIKNSAQNIETYALMGQSMGRLGSTF